ncbi:DUF4405 domain-containing protein [Aquibium microcysteis]|uniref:DUF4405 domain-containing protein n=1 Tax=Aquibium microcysteis TaxID=675281 RepID=UPI00165D2E4C|nr:DUF4405 domain-containing protein [Aquibium microcysteis]
MSVVVSRWATPLVTGLFVVSLVSGVAIFFGVGRAAFTGMHEWLSMVLVVPFVLHLQKNWRPFLAYFKRAPMRVALASSLAGALAFAAPSMIGGSTGAPPERQLIQLLPSRTVAQLAPLLGMAATDLEAALVRGGLKVTSPDEPIAQISADSSVTTSRVLAIALAAKPRPAGP